MSDVRRPIDHTFVTSALITAVLYRTAEIPRREQEWIRKDVTSCQLEILAKVSIERGVCWTHVNAFPPVLLVLRTTSRAVVAALGSARAQGDLEASDRRTSLRPTNNVNVSPSRWMRSQSIRHSFSSRSGAFFVCDQRSRDLVQVGRLLGDADLIANPWHLSRIPRLADMTSPDQA